MNSPMQKTPIIVHLHTHMPHVIHHDSWPHGSVWLSEVVCESYIPLLTLMRTLQYDGIQPRLSVDLSPILIEQLSHPDSHRLFTSYAEQQIKQARIDNNKFKSIPEAHCNIPMAEFWESYYQEALQYLHRLNNKTILHEFKKAQQDGLMEIMNCGLTHAYLPLLGSQCATTIQIAYSASVHEQYFGRHSSSMFLPECGYAPSMRGEHGDYVLEDMLLDASIQNIVLDQQHVLKYPSEFPLTMSEDLRPLQPIRLAGKSRNDVITALIRHKTASDKVWSELHGYPMNQAYLEFHKREFDSSLRYWKVTNHADYPDEKYPYSPSEAISQAIQDAKDYVHYLENIARSFYEHHSKTGIITLGFDTELFGHWWFEGPEFLMHVIRAIHDSDILEMHVPSEMSAEHTYPIVQCASGSWGLHGNDETWNNPKTSRLLENMHQVELQFIERKANINENDTMQVRIMNQALREIVLLQASDWPFLITKQQASDYAQLRFDQYLSNIRVLLSLFDKVSSGELIGEQDIQMLETIEQIDDVFQSLQIMDWKNH